LDLEIEQFLDAQKDPDSAAIIKPVWRIGCFKSAGLAILGQALANCIKI